MKKVLITGATGNVGIEVIKCLSKLNHTIQVFAGLRNVEENQKKLAAYPISAVQFDFTDSTTYKSALQNCNILFLLMPPQISKVEKHFKSFITLAKAERVEHILFLSVQGVKNNKIIPHYRIEKLIAKSNIAYTFLRPAYFMQNFTTVLRNDLVNKRTIFLPAGNAKFTLIDVRDIGMAAATIIAATKNHVNKSYDLTSDEKLTFEEMANKFTAKLGTKIQYQSPNLLKFYITKRREKVPTMFILVMIMLHYFQRFRKGPPISNCIEKITGRQPISFDQFVVDNKALLVK
ncbi:NmrA family NAD(P)-binding protein [uncultured Mucilaginibacter sp.]|uniref:NmrA family NAD(P)-binding protein n=1 Tax=uncultured Mucilaginibacter sp. TaxID=797541 RepID=UPI0026315090|nr:NmrA family NAD(P)-binding protein [uncultured Mucilaginibacter sp.]